MTEEEQAKALLPLFSDSPDYEECIRAAVLLRYKRIMDIIIQENDNDYQGDSILIGKDGYGQYYYCEWGWGSCSGCDMMQAESDNDTEENVVIQMLHSIVPIPHDDKKPYNVDQVLEYLEKQKSTEYRSDLIDSVIEAWKAYNK